MSEIHFQRPYDETTKKMLESFFGEAKAFDPLSMLYDHDQMPSIDNNLFKAIANKENQPVDVNLYKPGEIKTMSDGTQYQVDEKGNWRRIFP
jgi:hypothetical protein